MARRRKAPRKVASWARSTAVRNFLALNSLTAHKWPANNDYKVVMRDRKTIGYLHKNKSEGSALALLEALLRSYTDGP